MVVVVVDSVVVVVAAVVAAVAEALAGSSAGSLSIIANNWGLAPFMAGSGSYLDYLTDRGANYPTQDLNDCS